MGFTVAQTYLSDVLHVVAQSLLAPDIILLLGFIMYALFSIGSVVAEFFTERRHFKVVMPKFLAALMAAKEEDIPQVIEHSGLLKRQKAALNTVFEYRALSGDALVALVRRLVGEEETRYDRITGRNNMAAKITPMLGLMGTLIPLGPGIQALGTADTSALSSSLLVAFDTTVAGLVTAAVCLVVGKIRSNWYNNYLSALDAGMATMMEKIEDGRATSTAKLPEGSQDYSFLFAEKKSRLRKGEQTPGQEGGPQAPWKRNAQPEQAPQGQPGQPGQQAYPVPMPMGQVPAGQLGQQGQQGQMPMDQQAQQTQQTQPMQQAQPGQSAPWAQQAQPEQTPTENRAQSEQVPMGQQEQPEQTTSWEQQEQPEQESSWSQQAQAEQAPEQKSAFDSEQAPAQTSEQAPAQDIEHDDKFDTAPIVGLKEMFNTEPAAERKDLFGTVAEDATMVHSLEAHPMEVVDAASFGFTTPSATETADEAVAGAAMAEEETTEATAADTAGEPAREVVDLHAEVVEVATAAVSAAAVDSAAATAETPIATGEVAAMELVAERAAESAEESAAESAEEPLDRFARLAKTVESLPVGAVPEQDPANVFKADTAKDRTTQD